MHESTSSKQPKGAALAALLLLLAAPGARAQQCLASESAPQNLPALTLSTNPQYFRYNNATIPLIGISSEYLCHVAQPGTWFDNLGNPVTPDLVNCTWANYKAFIDRLALSGLNTMRVWIGMNHSPGEMRQGSPYPSEQPFTYNGSQWNLNSYDSTYWQRLKCVIGYAGTKGVIVQVTLFDPWLGDWNTSPWKSTNNTQGIGFSIRDYFAKYVNDPTKTDDAANAPARTEQMDLITKAVQELNAYPNLYWELANEPDLPPGTGPTAGRWQDRVALRIINEENVPGRLKHLIGVEQHTDAGVAVMHNASFNPSLNTAKVVNAHYVSVVPAKGDYGAIELIRTKNVPSGGITGRAFGFNEGKSTPFPTTAPSARAEAWEFALHEGGLYDNYNLKLYSSAGVVDAETNKVFNQLGKLKNFLTGLPGGLDAVNRDVCDTSACWLTGQGAYEAPDAVCAGWQGYKYWATMHSQSAYVAYFHHSRDTDLNGIDFSRYEPPPAGCPAIQYQETTLQFKPDVSGTYIAEWVTPGTNTVVQTNNLGLINAGVLTSLPASPLYSYDIALRIRKQ